MHKCLKCGAEITENIQFCTNCGTKLYLCAKCGAPYMPGDKFCDECGAPLSNETIEENIKTTQVSGNAKQSNSLNIIIGVLVALCLAGGGFYFYQQNVLIPREKAQAEAKIEAAKQEQEKIQAEAEKKKAAAEEKAAKAREEEKKKITRNDAISCINQYIGFLNQKNFGAAYAKYSDEWQSKTNYSKWSAAYGNTISQDIEIKIIDIISNNRARVNFVLRAKDSENGKVVHRDFSGHWDVVKDSTGGCRLDNPDVHLDKTY